MAAKTQLDPSATPGRRYGSFSGKPLQGHPVSRITQLAPSALPGRRYGTFSGKGATPSGAFWIFGDSVIS